MRRGHPGSPAAGGQQPPDNDDHHYHHDNLDHDDDDAPSALADADDWDMQRRGAPESLRCRQRLPAPDGPM